MTFKEQTSNVMTFFTSKECFPSSKSLFDCGEANQYQSSEYFKMLIEHVQPQVYLILNHLTDFLLTIIN
jgi:hypothetical protein